MLVVWVGGGGRRKDGSLKVSNSETKSNLKEFQLVTKERKQNNSDKKQNKVAQNPG